MTLLHRAFEAHAARAPDAIAVTDGDAAYSYAVLDTRANRIAHALIEMGVQPDMSVGLCAAPGIDQLAALIGILKAGAGYVALDPDLPAERLRLIESRAHPVCIVGEDAAIAGAGFEAPALFFDADARRVAAQPEHRPGVDPADDSLCYVMFTSGSTGVPNGVMVTHANLAGLFDGLGDSLGLCSDDVFTQLHRCAFGYSVFEIWGALSQGGRLVVVPPALRRDPDGLLALVRAQGVTVLSQTPTAFRQLLLPADLGARLRGTRLRLVALSGEAMLGADVARWFAAVGADGPRLVNTYAITETSGQLTLHEYAFDGPFDESARPIGRALPGAELHVLDPAGDAVPDGESGELYVGGPAVARGYIGEPELTAARFVVTGQGRLYRTGDRVRRQPDATFEYLGRVDQQIKLRGHRVEPAEIEAALNAHPGVHESAVMATGDDPRLTAWVVPDRQPEFWPSLGPYQLYDEFLYDLMGAEPERLARYRAAFRRHVPGKVVLDIGTGAHALLARMCIEAGAARVYAVELLDDAFEQARKVVERAGLADRIIVLQGDMASVELPEPVDVCTQGIIGNIGSADGIVPVWNAARRFFADSCVAVPAVCTTFIAPVELPAALAQRPAFGSLARQYVDKAFDLLGRPFDIRLCVRNLPPSSLLASPVEFERLDFSAALESDACGAAVFSVERAGRFDGFLLWTRVETGDTEVVDYLGTQQAWLPVFLPLPQGGAQLAAGDRIDAEWHIDSRSDACPDYTVSGHSACGSFVCHSAFDEAAWNSTALHRALWSSSEALEQDLSPRGLADWLAARLPAHMVPVDWMLLDALPVNHNGKLDRGALPAPPRAQHVDRVLRAPATALQQALCDTFAEVLDVPRVGIDDDFFDLGGDSIAAVRLTGALQRLLDDGVMLIALFNAPTVAALADYLEQHHAPAVRRMSTAADDAPALLMEQGEL